MQWRDLDGYLNLNVAFTHGVLKSELNGLIVNWEKNYLFFSFFRTPLISDESHSDEICVRDQVTFKYWICIKIFS
jgi:hypothetical protein